MSNDPSAAAPTPPAAAAAPAAAPTPPPPGASSPGGDGQPANPVASAPAAFDGLPEHLTGKSPEELVPELLKISTGLRKELSGRDAPPKDVAGYTLGEFSKEAAPYAQALEEDKVLASVKQVALDAGIPAKAFAQFIPKVFDAFVNAGVMEPVIDYAAENAKLVPATASHLDENGKKAAVAQRVQSNIDFIKGLAGKGLDESAAQLLITALPDTHAGNLAMEFIRKQFGEAAPVLNGSGAPSGLTAADFDAHQAKPESNPNHPGHRDWARTKTDLAKKIWGSAPAHGPA